VTIDAAAAAAWSAALNGNGNGNGGGPKLQATMPGSDAYYEQLAAATGRTVGELRATASQLSLVTPSLQAIARIDWAWRLGDGGFLPVGYFNLLVGEEGLGKTVLVCWITARLTRGELPGDFAGDPQNVLIVADEDDVNSVWTPRLVAAGADLSRVRFLASGEDVSLANPDDVERLRRAIDKTPVGFVVFDQLLDQLDGGQDGAGVYNAKHVRGQIRPLRRLVRAAHDGRGAASLSLLHPIKGRVQTFRDLVGGSHQFNALSRSSLLLARDPHDERGAALVLVRGKGNLSVDPGSFEFEIAGREFDVPHLDPPRLGAPTVIEPEYGTRTKEQLLHLGERKAEVLDAMKIAVRGLLKADDRTLADLCRAAGAKTTKDGTVRRALEALAEDGVATSTLNDKGSVVGWRLAQETTE
jgi:hypothetical protein